MASYHAAATISTSILRLLEDAYPRAEFGPLSFDLYQTTSFQGATIERGFSLFLYRIGINRTRRNAPERPVADWRGEGRDRRPSRPLGVDLYYLLTAWAPSADTQQLLLTWAMCALEDNAVLPAGYLNDHAPRPDVFAPAECVELTADPLSLQDVYPLWELLKPKIPLSATYVARLIDIESLRDDTAYPPVQSVVFDYARGPES